jgi:hypothetical protein
MTGTGRGKPGVREERPYPRPREFNPEQRGVEGLPWKAKRAEVSFGALDWSKCGRLLQPLASGAGAGADSVAGAASTGASDLAAFGFFALADLRPFDFL